VNNFAKFSLAFARLLLVSSEVYISDWRLVNLKRCYLNSISKPSRYRQFLSVASGLFFNECGESFLGEGIFWEIVLVS